jgi:HprK-related kinase A
MIRFEDGHVVPLARPINLKNASIGVIRKLIPDAVFSREVRDTVKGTVALLRPPGDSVARVGETAPARWIVFPSWRPDGSARLESVPKAEAFMTVVRNSTNYDIHGARGFELLASVIETCGCFQFAYRDFDDAIRTFDELAAAA